MRRKVAGTARNSCPRCGQLVSVSWLYYLGARSGPSHVRCRTCKSRLIVAGSTNLLALAGLFVGALVGGSLTAHLAGDRTAFPVGGGIGACLGVAILGRLGLRLEIEERD